MHLARNQEVHMHFTRESQALIEKRVNAIGVNPPLRAEPWLSSPSNHVCVWPR
jgi:hypothetical protein